VVTPLDVEEAKEGRGQWNAAGPEKSAFDDHVVAVVL
jgi:hypothetical protein